MKFWLTNYRWTDGNTQVSPSIVPLSGTISGGGYIMYTQQSVSERFRFGSEDQHFVCVFYRQDSWRYDDGVTTKTFEPIDSDLLVAGFNDRNIVSFQGSIGTIMGISRGYRKGNLNYSVAPVFNGGGGHPGFKIEGSFFGNSNEDISGWHFPRGVISAIDLLDNQSENPPITGQDRLGCFCVTPNDVNLPDSHLLGQGNHPSEIAISGSSKSAWQQHNGGYRPNGNTVLELLRDHFQNIQDCIMPGVDRKFKIYLGVQRPINVWPLQLKQANNHRTRMLARYRKMTDQAFQGDLESVRGRKVLDKILEDLFGLRDHEARQEIWRKEKDTLLQYLLPPNVRNTPGPAKHDTLLADDFNRANGSLGANWVRLGANPWLGTLTISGNRVVQNSQPGWYTIYRYNTSLSSDNHYSSVEYAVSGLYHTGGAVRVSNGTCYISELGTSGARIIKWVSGTPTDYSFTTSFSVGDRVKTACDGSSIYHYVNDSLRHQITDTSISGTTDVGIAMVGNGTLALDNWQAEELNPPSSDNNSFLWNNF